MYLAIILWQDQESPRQTKPRKGQFMNSSRGHSRTEVQCESCLLSQGKTPEFTNMGEIHELFVLALSLVCWGDSWQKGNALQILKSSGMKPSIMRCHEWEVRQTARPQSLVQRHLTELIPVTSAQAAGPLRVKSGAQHASSPAPVYQWDSLGSH